MYHFFTSIEFYVIACVVAAAIVIISAMPKQVGEARQFLLAGFLCSDTDNDDEEETLPQRGQSSNLPDNTPSGKIQSLPNNIPSNVSFSNNLAIPKPTSTPTPAPQPEPSIVEVTENGEREIPTSKGKNKGKNNRNQSLSSSTIPKWITGTVEGKEPEIDLLCMEDGTVKLIRKGLNGLVTADGAVSLACTLIGFDLKIEERLTYGGRNLKDPAPTEAVFTLDFLAPNEHYHIHYNSDTIHRMTAFTLATKDGIHIVRTLS